MVMSRPTFKAATKILGDRVEITIRDSRTGIPTEVREKMFNPFGGPLPARPAIAARIFCRRIEAELLAIDGVYRTANPLARRDSEAPGGTHSLACRIARVFPFCW
jgi:hypothetical protein